MKKMKPIVAAVLISAGFFFSSFTTPGTQEALFLPQPCPKIYAPVCTFDGREFPNYCYAERAGYSPDEYERCGGIIFE